MRVLPKPWQGCSKAIGPELGPDECILADHCGDWVRTSYHFARRMRRCLFMRHQSYGSIVLTCYLAAGTTLYGQASKPGPDVLVFVDGEKLIGHLESATGASVVFKSDMAGEVTVDWSKIQELRSSEKFA